VLPVAIGVLGIVDFLVIGFMLLTYFTKRVQVNTMRCTKYAYSALCLFIQMC